MNLKEFILANGLSMTFRETAQTTKHLSNMPAGSKFYVCTIGSNGTGMSESFEYSMGPACSEPTLSGVLDSLRSDALSFENSDSVSEFAAEFGYEDVSTAYRVRAACGRISRQLKTLLGEQHYAELLFEMED